MKTILLVIAMLVASFALGAAKPANYAGSWTLDMKQSKNLPRYYERVKSHQLNITQDDKHLSVAVEIGHEQGEPDKINFIYNLDGSETKTETKIRTQNGLVSVPTTLKATVTDNGGLHITIGREIPMGDQTFKGVSVEDWQLSADKKTLTIHRADETPRGKMEADMIFLKG